ncbi:MAG TPA: 6-phosphogluconolactonase [Candidatus Dormibacteraeota bacterium]
MPAFQVLPDAAAVARAAAEAVRDALAGGARTLVLAGGTTPGLAYQELAGMDVAWGRVTVLFGDERCVPPDDPESNYRMARETLLSRVVPASVHRMAGELGPDEAAAEYESVVRTLEPLDVVLLGVGEDGHTASLFPGNPALEAASLVTGVRGAPKPPPERVSLTFRTLRSAHLVLVLATGAGKADAVVKARAGSVPSGMIDQARWLLDPAAAGSAP